MFSWRFKTVLNICFHDNCSSLIYCYFKQCVGWTAKLTCLSWFFFWWMLSVVIHWSEAFGSLEILDIIACLCSYTACYELVLQILFLVFDAVYMYCRYNYDRKGTPDNPACVLSSVGTEPTSTPKDWRCDRQMWYLDSSTAQCKHLSFSSGGKDEKVENSVIFQKCDQLNKWLARVTVQVSAAISNKCPTHWWWKPS